MFSKNILFVLGAGASAEVHFPTSFELKREIAELINFEIDSVGRFSGGDLLVTKAIERIEEKNFDARKFEPYIEAAQIIKRGMAQDISIDTFIERHEENKKIELCGKLAICQGIIKAEKACALYFDSHVKKFPDFNGVSDTWFYRFWQILNNRVKLNNVAQIFQNLSIINFNYDRCVEHFLFWSLKSFYSLNDTAAKEIMANLPIVHPYGMVGKLEWQEKKDTIPFGTNLTTNSLINVSKQIKTYNERQEDEVALNNIKGLVKKADIIVFLGFAFHDQNINLIRPEINKKDISIFGTARDLSSDDKRIIIRLLRTLGDIDRDLTLSNIRTDFTCNNLLKEHWKYFLTC